MLQPTLIFILLQSHDALMNAIQVNSNSSKHNKIYHNIIFDFEKNHYEARLFFPDTYCNSFKQVNLPGINTYFLCNKAFQKPVVFSVKW